MKDIYVIISGGWDDRTLHGFVNDRDTARKYCAVKNQNLGPLDDLFSCCKLSDLSSDIDVSKVVLSYKHEVVFDFKHDCEDIDFVMRDEKNRFDYYIGELKETSILFRGFDWIAFNIYSNTENRDTVEYIAKSLVKRLSELNKDINNINDSIRALSKETELELLA